MNDPQLSSSFPNPINAEDVFQVPTAADAQPSNAENSLDISPRSVPVCNDPFAAPSLIQASAPDNAATERVEQSLSQLADIKNQLANGESAGASLAPPSRATAKPTVEVIGAAESSLTAPSTSSPKIEINCQVATKSSLEVTNLRKKEDSFFVPPSDQSTVETTSDQAETSTEFENEQTIHEYELALNGLVNDPEAVEQTEPTPTDVRIPLAHDPDSNEPLYDVRDFADVDGTPNPIAGSFVVAPDTFDHWTSESIALPETDLPKPIQPAEPNDSPSVTDHSTSSVDEPATESDIQAHANSASTTPPLNATTDATTHEQVFLAENDETIQLSGNDGFDVIDLKCFDVSCATFSPNLILVDDGQGTRIRIEHVGIELAIFANDFEVDLTSPQPSI
ncbi:MAG: hypothetical protein AAFN77_22125 [Planctomycetota bacterium]